MNPLWKIINKDDLKSVTKGNYERLFNAARTKVRKWERENVLGK
jgi:hypothetical protein